jgi:hypothetical protein
MRPFHLGPIQTGAEESRLTLNSGCEEAKRGIGGEGGIRTAFHRTT